MAGSYEEQPPVESAVELVGRSAQLRGQTVSAGVKLGIIDLLNENNLSAESIASQLSLPDRYTKRILRALEVYGVLESNAAGRYSVTAVGERFLSDHPESVRDYILFFYNPTRFAAVRHLPEIVNEGGPTGYELEFDKSMFEKFEEDSEFSEQFNGMQDLSSLGETQQILDTLEAVDFTQFGSVCDVGGGYGDLLSHLLERHSHLAGTVLELPSVLEDEERLWAPKVGVDDRLDYVAGDMFEGIPTADAYILKAILHDWSDEDCVQILSNIHEAAPKDGQLFVRERIISEDDPDPATIDMDIWMMLETGGQERTRAEFQTLFDESGWELAEVLAVDDEISIMRSTKK